jgi:hypothetical protein
MKSKLILILIVATSYVNVFAQSDSSHFLNLQLKTDLAFPLLTLTPGKNAGFSLTLEKGFKQRHAFQISYIYYAEHLSYQRSERSVEILNRWNRAVLSYKCFASKKQPFSGAYAGAYFRGGLDFSENTRVNHSSPSLNFSTLTRSTSFSSGLLVGYQLFFWKRLVVDFFAGLGANQQSNKVLKIEGEGTLTFPPIRTEADFRLGLNVGYRF